MNAAMLNDEFYRYRFLIGAMQRFQVLHTVRLLAIPDEVARLEEVGDAWDAASERMSQLTQAEQGEPDQVTVANLPAVLNPRLQEISDDRLFKVSFSALPTTFKLVELDRLVAPQRDVNLDYVEEVQRRIPGNTAEALVDFCLAPRGTPPDLKVLQTAQNQVIATSKSLDLRFLGGFRKPLGEDDIAAAHAGGHPVEAIVLLMGYGASPVNVFSVGNRLVLSNGFHRVVAMRTAGITHAPVVVQRVVQPAIEFAEQVLGLPRDYLLEAPRPVLIKDFFDPALTLEVRMIPRRKTLRVSWAGEDSIIPV